MDVSSCRTCRASAGADAGVDAVLGLIRLCGLGAVSVTSNSPVQTRYGSKFRSPITKLAHVYLKTSPCDAIWWKYDQLVETS
jgi:hypothetical protein